jgi:hypothetical protein
MALSVPPRLDRRHGKPGPVGELRGDEARDERGIRRHLVVVHARHPSR